jgi:DNA-binding IclR family transcriptional regulator
LRQEILDLLAEQERAMTPKEVAQALGKSENTVKKYLLHMYEDHLVVKQKYGHYALPPATPTLFEAAPEATTDEGAAD